jgi:hypothetical protein
MYHVWGRREIHRGFCYRTLKEGNELEDLGVGGKIFLQVT